MAARDGEPPIDRLRELAAPEALDTLLQVALGRSLRSGPRGASELGSPARLLSLAADASRAGALPLSTVVDLRRSLDRLADAVRASGAWADGVPLWWSPLPAEGDLESLARELAEASVGVPPAGASERLVPAEADDAPGWIHWDAALPPALLERTAAELSAAATDGRLALRAAGVGRADRRSSRRSDEARYLTGLESDLLMRTPTLAVLVQHLLDRLEEPLRRLLPAATLHAPQTAMLARYRAPCPGFAAHLDNPGGEDDNGRALTLILYLSPPDRPCRGGGLALWPRGTSPGDDPPAAVLPPAGGSAVLFDARTVAHAVEPLEPGPDRWTLVLWLSERRRRPPRPLVPVPATEATQVLLAVDEPPVAPGAVLFRQADPDGARPTVEVHRPAPDRRPRSGVVTTVRGAGEALEGWCRHHLDLGLDRIVLVLDEGAGPDEAAELQDLRRSTDPGRVAVWTDGEARRRRRSLPVFEGMDRLLAAANRGPATWAVAARQTLNATAALHAARAEGLDWLVHLDADEVLYLEGSGRGGATLAEHLAAAEAAGWRSLRYLDHELLVPWRPGEPPRFKRNPAVAAERLGVVGWRRLARHLAMEQGDRRPYFRAYWNGKSAVAVTAGERAAGVHGWHVPGAPDPPLLAGPSILHFHLPTVEAFRRKYLLVAEAPGDLDDPDRPFPPSALERAAVSLVRELRAAGAPEETVSRRLDALYAASASFAPEEVELLEEAGLLFTPRIVHHPLPSRAAAVDG